MKIRSKKEREKRTRTTRIKGEKCAEGVSRMRKRKCRGREKKAKLGKQR